jgi:hypothetical protein
LIAIFAPAHDEHTGLADLLEGTARALETGRPYAHSYRPAVDPRALWTGRSFSRHRRPPRSIADRPRRRAVPFKLGVASGEPAADRRSSCSATSAVRNA